jgi:hypothetical protein
MNRNPTLRNVQSGLLIVASLCRTLPNQGGDRRPNPEQGEEGMIRRTTIISLAALCAVALSALAASGASAGTTEFTCVAGGEPSLGKFSDADCSTPSPGGEFGHVKVTEQTTTKFVSLANPVLTGKLFGATIELTATGMECVECRAENKEVGGVMEFTGSGGKVKFTGVTAVGLPACNVNGGSITTEKGKFTTTVSTEGTIEPETGTTLAVFNITGTGCTIAGNNIKVTGKVPGTHSGARVTVNITKASGFLSLEGEKASVKGEGTVSAGQTPSGPFHPASLTTS